MRASNTNAATPTGRLIRKISRQDTSVSRPPTSGPELEASAPPMAHTATARARRTGSG